MPLIGENDRLDQKKLHSERGIDRFYYLLRRLNMTYETKNITFHVIHVKLSSDSQCSRTLPMNIAIESAHCGCERNCGHIPQERVVVIVS